MTGEITLRGRVLPIGGLKEKILAAHRSDIFEVLVPRENLKDLKDIPKRVLKVMKVVPVEHMDEVLRAGLRLEHPEEFLPSRSLSVDWRQPAAAAAQLPAADPMPASVVHDAGCPEAPAATGGSALPPRIALPRSPAAAPQTAVEVGEGDEGDDGDDE
jgi:hypothetical protein